MKPMSVIQKLNESSESEAYLEKMKNLRKNANSLADSIKGILSKCNADISYVECSIGDYVDISLSCKFKADKISSYDNDVSLYGRIHLDDDLKLVKADIKTSSGPNVLNYDFIRALNALYEYFSSGNKHYSL